MTICLCAFTSVYPHFFFMQSVASYYVFNVNMCVSVYVHSSEIVEFPHSRDFTLLQTGLKNRRLILK